MNHARELTVGITLVVAVVLFFIGVRYFQDLPLFGGGYSLETSFANAQGLVSGSPVRINGVSAGTVRRVDLRPAQDDVFVEFEMHGDVRLPHGTRARVGGTEMLGNVYLELMLGDGAGTIEPGGTVRSEPGAGLGDVMNRAPALAARADSVLAASLLAIDDVRSVLHTQSAALEQTMAAMRTAADGFNRTLATNETAVSRLLEHSAILADDLSTFTSANRDSMTLALQQFNHVLRLLDARLQALEGTTAEVDALLAGVARGEGTIGMLATDPSLYHRLDSTLSNLNELLVALERNPERFMRELRLIDLF